MIADLLDRVASGDIRVVIDRTFPLAEAADAHAYIESRQAFGRVGMTPLPSASSPVGSDDRPSPKGFRPSCRYAEG
jgi:hypothetical protein